MIYILKLCQNDLQSDTVMLFCAMMLNPKYERCSKSGVRDIDDTQFLEIQSTLVTSNSKGLSEILRDIRTSTYKNCRIEEKINRTTTFNKCICNWTLEIRDILKILWKRGEIAPLEQFLLFSTIFYYLLLYFHL